MASTTRGYDIACHGNHCREEIEWAIASATPLTTAIDLGDPVPTRFWLGDTGLEQCQDHVVSDRIALEERAGTL